MSITFRIKNGPTEIFSEECYCGDEAADPSCHYCKGSGRYSFEEDIHSVNMSNMNSGAIMRVIGIPFDYCGEIQSKDLSTVRQCIFVALNRDSQRSNEHREQKVEGNFFTSGINDEYIVRRLKELDSLCRAAQEFEESVVWS